MKSAAEILLEEMNTWYNQLYNLNVERKVDSEDYRKERYLYSQNRLVLPNYLKNLNVLKQSKKYSIVVQKAETFLQLVTDYDTSQTQIVTSCLYPIIHHFGKDGLLKKLDILLQEMSLEVGKISK